MMRILLDADVLAPGFLNPNGASGRLIDRWQSGDFELIVSEHVLSETVSTFGDRYFRTRIQPDRVQQVVELLRRRAVLTEITVEVKGIATQPKDDLVLATGLSGGASYLGTRDRQLLKLAQFRSLRIASPAQLLRLLEIEP